MPKIGWWESHRNLGFWGTVAAGLVLLALAWFFGLIHLGQIAIATWHVFVYRVPVPLMLLAAMIALLLMAGVSVLKRAALPPPPPWLEYQKDTFVGVVWRWSYLDNAIKRSSLTPYCPRCSLQLRVGSGAYRSVSTSLHCDDCRTQFEIEGPPADVFERVCRLIEREVNQKFLATS